MRAKDFIPTEKPRNFVAKNAKMGGAGQHKDKKKAEKQGDVKHKKKQQGVAEEFGPLPKDNQQIRLGRHTVDIERVGLDNDYISFAWNDSQGQDHYEEVPVGDLGSYDDLIKRIKQEISYQERQYTDQGVGEAFSQAAADRNKIKYQKTGRIGHGVGWKPMSDNPKEISNDIFDHFNNITRLVQYDELKSDHSRHKFVERFFKKYGYPFEVFPEVISLIDQHLADEYAKARKGRAD
jgi:hypothetical protein